MCWEKNQLLRQGDMKSEMGIWLRAYFGGSHPKFIVGSKEGDVVVAPGLLQPSQSRLLFAMVENR